VTTGANKPWEGNKLRNRITGLENKVSKKKAAETKIVAKKCQEVTNGTDPSKQNPVRKKGGT